MTDFLLPDEEMSLMCRIIMEDSSWLDSFQKSILRGEGKTNGAHDRTLRLDDYACRNGFQESNCRNTMEDIVIESSARPPEHQPVLLLNDDSEMVGLDSTTRLKPVLSRNYLGDRGLQENKAFMARTLSAPMSIVNQLPAPEFVDHMRSLVACESMRMISAAAAMYRSGPSNFASQASHQWD